jgi:hypothetical protein
MELRSRLVLVRETGNAWLCASGRSTFPHDVVVTKLADAMRSATSPVEQLLVLERHHREHGSGRLWFREQGGKIVPLVADTGIAASDYRFRLRSLSRLAAQCGVARMKAVLDAVEKDEFEDVAGHEPDDEEVDVL